jgi:ribonuclease HI
MTEKLKNVTIYTDGGCLGNPGPGGYGVVLLYGAHRKELSGGYRLTTNNRMEIMAAIAGLRTLKGHCTVTLYTDSQYLANAIMKGWAKRWQAHGWKRNKSDKALNPDLWQALLELCDKHLVTLTWIKAHAGTSENERCDALSRESARRPDLPPDHVYEAQQSRF